MTRKSCAVEMCNAILRNYLKDYVVPEWIWNVWNSFCKWNGTRPFGPFMIHLVPRNFQTSVRKFCLNGSCPVWTLPLWQCKAKWMSLDPTSKQPAFWPPSRRGLGTRKRKLIFSLSNSWSLTKTVRSQHPENVKRFNGNCSLRKHVNTTSG